MSALRPFHIAFPVHDLESARQFYGEVLGCPVGRTDPLWVDFNLMGHQITAHLTQRSDTDLVTNPVDGRQIPVRHWGVILTMSEWNALVQELQQQSISFLVEPTIRFSGLAGEQATFFVQDPSGNTLEFKAFANDSMIFAPFDG
ncbi:MAG: VOC family protein [Synechococcaceae cyanobacterium SM2_3_1]|nr:VOC family protein [Synechococcaceae cyanobacterium SM2_3_1]